MIRPCRSVPRALQRRAGSTLQTAQLRSGATAARIMRGRTAQMGRSWGDVKVWPPVEHPCAEPGEWFQDLRHVVYLFDEIPRQPFDIADEYVQSIRTIEALITARDTAKAVIPRG